MKYRVMADISSVLRCVVEASDGDEAIAKAKELAHDGLMEEVETSGDIGGWEAVPVGEQRR